jgi:subtilisin family serine protease
MDLGRTVDQLILKHTGRPDPGVIPVLLSIASCASNVSVDASTVPLKTIPEDLLSRTFSDPEVGINTPDRMATWKQNLSRIVPAIQAQIAEIPDAPQMRVADAVRYVSALMSAVPETARLAARETAPLAFTVGPMAEARKRVADRFGAAFASKASAPLTRLMGGPGRESMLETAPVPVVLEFDHSDVQNIPPANLPRTDQTMVRALRHLAVEAAQNAFYRKISTVRAVLENRSGPGMVQICWLNGTVRVATQLASIAQVADEDTLQIMDLPRKLKREIEVGAVTIGAPPFRQRFGKTGAGIRVAVIDGEVKADHPAFGGRISLQENLTREPFGSPDPHATGAAGIIGGEDPVFGGIAPGASIMNYKIFATDPRLDADDFGGSLAIEHALRDGAEIANCSWGAGPAGDGTGREARACNTAWARGLIIVKSAGNSGPAAGSMTTPADADGVIVVGATDRQGTAVQDYSSRGPTVNGKRPHLVAPGGTELDPLHSCLSVITSGAFGEIGFGTSFAAPMVSGTIVLLLEQTPDADPDTIRQKLTAICRPFAGNTPDEQGAGVLDLSLF